MERIYISIPEQFTVKAHPALFEGEGLKNWGTLPRGFGLRNFCPEISAWGVFVGRRFRPGPKSPISPAENSAFSRDGRGVGGKGRGGRGLMGSLWPIQCHLETQVEGAEHVNFFT